MAKPVFIIGEIAQAHDGSLGLAHSYIDALAACGVDAVKFQTHIADAESSPFETFRVNFSYVDTTRQDYWRRMEFSPEQWLGLKQHCEAVGVEFISSPFSCEAVDLLERLKVKQYKIGSGEVNNYLMLHKIADTGKPIILSSGMSDYVELDSCIQFLNSKNAQLSLLQCTTAYPTQPIEWGLLEIPKLKERYQIPIGYSDHSASPTACIAATALGAEILEFHAVFDKKMFGPDSKASLDINEIADMVSHIRKLEISLNAPGAKADASSFNQLKTMFGKSIAVNKNLLSGHVICREDLESKKPGNMGINAKDYETVLGQKLKTDKAKWEFLQWEDFE